MFANRARGGTDEAQLGAQAALKNTDIEIPALEGAVLATRLEAVNRGLLSQAAFDAGLALSQAMTKLQPAVAAGGAIDGLQCEIAANSSRQLSYALEREAGAERNYRFVPQMPDSPGVITANPYTGTARTTMYGLTGKQELTSNAFDHLPELIHDGSWTKAFRMYRSMMDGLDRWVADQLRAHGKGPTDAAKGDAHQHNAAMRTGLEQIAGKHARGCPRCFTRTRRPSRRSALPVDPSPTRCR